MVVSFLHIPPLPPGEFLLESMYREVVFEPPWRSGQALSSFLKTWIPDIEVHLHSTSFIVKLPN